MKGQIFIVVSILVAVSLLLISANKISSSEPSDYLKNYYTDLKAELVNTVDTGLMNGDFPARLDNFIAFSNGVLSQKGYTQDIQYHIVGSSVIVDVSLSKGNEYYRDTITIDRTVST